jgi:hypothetical protein
MDARSIRGTVIDFFDQQSKIRNQKSNKEIAVKTSHYIQHMVNLHKTEEAIIQRCAEKKGLGTKGFSAALRLIVREWDDYRRVFDIAEMDYLLGNEE